MGMSYYVQGFVSPDNEQYQKHCKVLRACIDAGVSLPKETAEFFGDDSPEEYLFEDKLQVEVPNHEWNGDCANGLEIKVSEIPKEVDTIRFVMSY